MKTLDIPTPASDTDSSPPASEKRYTVQFYMAPPQSLARVAVVLRGVDSAFLEKGLFWTSQNLLLGGHLRSFKSGAMWKGRERKWAPDMVRTWELRERPGRPLAESRWSREVSLCAESAQTLDGFRLGQLRRQMSYRMWVTDNACNEVCTSTPGIQRRTKTGFSTGTLPTCGGFRPWSPSSPTCGGFGPWSPSSRRRRARVRVPLRLTAGRRRGPQRVVSPMAGYRGLTWQFWCVLRLP